MTVNNCVFRQPFYFNFYPLLCASIFSLFSFQPLSAQLNSLSRKLYKCELNVEGNRELQLDYLEVTDSTLTLFITHTLSGDSMLFEEYSLREIECINRSKRDTVRTYQSNMLLAQDKRVYAGTSNSYSLTFRISIAEHDTIVIHQNLSSGPLRFPGFCLNQFAPVDNIPSEFNFRSEVTTGTVAFYTRQRLGDLNVFIDSEFVGTIKDPLNKKSPTPGCGDIGATLVNKRLPSGSHSYRVTNKKFAWEGEFYILRECCIRIQIEK